MRCVMISNAITTEPRRKPEKINDSTLNTTKDNATAHGYRLEDADGTEPWVAYPGAYNRGLRA